MLTGVGFMYDPGRTYTMPIALATGVAASINGLFGKKLPLGAAGFKPLRVDRVADAAVEAIADPNISGKLDPDELDELATKVWRRQML